jgi:hypothetical protein
MLKSAALLVMLVAAPAFAQEGARTDFATVKKLAEEAVAAVRAHTPAETALSLAQVNLSDEIAHALRTPHGERLKVAPR